MHVKRILFAIYPFLIASTPILALRNYNIAYVDLASILRTLILANLLTALIWLLRHSIPQLVEIRHCGESGDDHRFVLWTSPH